MCKLICMFIISISITIKFWPTIRMWIFFIMFCWIFILQRTIMTIFTRIELFKIDWTIYIKYIKYVVKCITSIISIDLELWNSIGFMSFVIFFSIVKLISNSSITFASLLCVMNSFFVKYDLKGVLKYRNKNLDFSFSTPQKVTTASQRLLQIS